MNSFQAVVRLTPDAAALRDDLALALKKTGQLDSAIAEYQASLSIEPEFRKPADNKPEECLSSHRGDYAAGDSFIRWDVAPEPSV